MNFSTYQLKARQTAIYDKEKYAIIYPALGLAGESGETVEKVKKFVRDGKLDRDGLLKEMGDVLWYLANMASDLGVSLETIAEINIEKLEKRAANNTLQGSGDNR